MKQVETAPAVYWGWSTGTDETDQKERNGVKMAKRKFASARSLCADPYNNADYCGYFWVKFLKVTKNLYWAIFS